MSTLTLTEETADVLWSVRTPQAVYLVVRERTAEWSNFDVHKVSGGGVEYLDTVTSLDSALGSIRQDLND